MKITDEQIEHLTALTKLELDDIKKDKVKRNLNNMIEFINQMNDLDTEEQEPMFHLFPVNNVFREDIVVNGDNREEILSNAPTKKNGSFQVPRTVE